MRLLRWIYGLIATLLRLCTTARGGVSVSDLFADHMVLT